MALFDVPGWSVASAPVSEASTQVSKKRKRPASPTSTDSSKFHSAEVNLEKLVQRLKGNSSKDEDRSKTPERKSRGGVAGFLGMGRSAKRDSKTIARGRAQDELKKTISQPKALRPKAEASSRNSSPRRPAKKVKAKHGSSESVSMYAPTTIPVPVPAEKPEMVDDSSSGLTAMQKSMKQSLDGARFRLINETLYKTDSASAHQMMREDPKVYEEYHTGFRHQVHSWPTNPVQHYIAILSSYPQKTVVADLGCGDAALARALIPKELTVLSFDLVSDGNFVVEADICDKIPLPGSDGSADEGPSYGQGHVVDVVVCALSLMGTNWANCIREAWRVLKPEGELKIAEVASRFTNVDEFTALVNSIGFRLTSKDDRNSHFTLFEFKKVARKAKGEKEWAKLLAKGSVLKPCEYKRR